MKTFNEFIEHYYIDNIETLKANIQKINEKDEEDVNNFEDDTDSYRILSAEELEERNGRSIELSDNLIKNTKLQKVERLILIGEMHLKSIQMLSQDNIKEEFAAITDFNYTTKKNSITIKSGKNTIKVSSTDAKNTIVLVRSGYTKPIVSCALSYLEELGILVINPVNEVRISSDKFLTAEMLSKYNISQPKYCLITSEDIDKEDTKKADEKIKELYSSTDDNTKFVCKILNGHGGRGVFICRKSNVMSILQCIFAINPKCPILVQEYGELKDGDIRVHVVSLNGKQKVVDSIIRLKGKSDFRTNLSLGNQMDAYTLSDTQKQLALDAAKASGLVWCGVDIMPLTNGKNKIVEINGAPGPASNIDDKDIEVTNYKFFKKIINTINSLCQQ